MWRLDQFRFDEQIDATDVSLFDEDLGQLVPMSRDLAIDSAHARGGSLVASWPASRDGVDSDPSCIVAKVSLPVRWEQIPDETQTPDFDEELWFEAYCGGRDFLLEGQGHTFPGRMTAWCPNDEVGYSVSLADMGEMSEASRYFIRGFLSGAEPSPPEDDEGYIEPADLIAWRAATKRFRETGLWYGRWGTCSVCGCVLLPDTAEDRCHEHAGP